MSHDRAGGHAGRPHAMVGVCTFCAGPFVNIVPCSAAPHTNFPPDCMLSRKTEKVMSCRIQAKKRMSWQSLRCKAVYSGAIVAHQSKMPRSSHACTILGGALALDAQFFRVYVGYEHSACARPCSSRAPAAVPAAGAPQSGLPLQSQQRQGAAPPARGAARALKKPGLLARWPRGRAARYLRGRGWRYSCACACGYTPPSGPVTYCPSSSGSAYA
jgi:hypothetical protein